MMSCFEPNLILETQQAFARRASSHASLDLLGHVYTARMSRWFIKIVSDLNGCSSLSIILSLPSLDHQ